MPAIATKRKGGGGGGTGARTVAAIELSSKEVYVFDVTDEYITIYTEKEAVDRLEEIKGN